MGDVSGVAVCGRPEAKELRSKPAGVAEPLCPGVKPAPVSWVVYPDTTSVSPPGVPADSGIEATCAVSRPWVSVVEDVLTLVNKQTIK